ncbi:UNVERIFIED_CONTAM: hypothetical protein PYX00_010699 [Menopon gallinae]|uniref:NADPH:adrenodoxin oxidoreductase, mitochondrial n=1 Tax=Menopon gallinae TaxID=328185 RepID=A0AAW2HGM7_9NEOP
MHKVGIFGNIASNIFTTVKKKYCSGRTGKICIVGGGPAGFYAAQRLIKLLPEATVDIYEKLPVPFGLVRYGVAPDHPEVKNVINTFTKTAKSPQVSFFGNVTLGRDITLNDLQFAYHAVLLTYGAEGDRRLNIPGENLENVLSAKRFVGWYNGVPADKELKVDLGVENVIVIGQGNVAIDVARILLSPIDKLKITDITEYSLEQLTRSKVRKVSLVGRRGPLQVAFTIKELREMLNLPGVTTVFQKEDVEGINNVISDLPRPRRRLTELLYKSAMECKNLGNNKVFDVVFKRTPVQFLGSNKVEQVEFVVNKLTGDDIESQKAVVTDEKVIMPCGLALRSIGYKGVQAEGNIPFDTGKGTALNENGKIAPGLYCSGWLSTGPLGVILSTMTNAFNTAQIIYDDINRQEISIGSPKPGSSHILEILKTKGWI